MTGILALRRKAARFPEGLKRGLILLLAAALLACALPAAAEGPVPQPWPEDGVMYCAFDDVEDGTVLHVRFKGQDGQDGLAAELCLYSQEKEMVLTLFIRCGGEVIVRMPGGTYIVRHSVGADWYGPEDGFGDGSWSDQEGPNCAGLRQEDRLMTFEDGMEYMLTVEGKTGDEHPWEEWGDFLQ